MNEEKKEEKNNSNNIENNSSSEKVEVPRIRKLVIETDGNKIRLVVNELSGMLELKAILTELLTNIR